MSSQEIKYLVNKATEKDILAHFNTCDEDFLKNLKEKVDLQQYSKKLFEKSARFEAWHNNSLVGFVSAYFNDHENSSAYISNVSVSKDFLNKGIASSLLEKTIKYAKEKSFKTLDLEISKSNERAMNLYKKFGFIIFGESEKDYKMRLKF